MKAGPCRLRRLTDSSVCMPEVGSPSSPEDGVDLAALMSVMIKAGTGRAILAYCIFSYGVPDAIASSCSMMISYCLLLTTDIHNRYIQFSLSARQCHQLHKSSTSANQMKQSRSKRPCLGERHELAPAATSLLCNSQQRLPPTGH
jgi:hypothetical protein